MPLCRKETKMEMMSRRGLLTKALIGSAAVGTAALLGACSTVQLQNFEGEWTSIVSQVQQDVAIAASYVPTVESIASTAASLFGPQWEAAVAAGEVVVNTIVAALEAAAQNLTPPAAARMRRRLAASSPSAPVYIGVTPQGVPVNGYKVG